jgi:hypothetical protein
MTTASPQAAQTRDPYAAQGPAPTDDKAARIKRISAEDAQFRDAFPLAAVSQAKRRPGLRLAEIVQIVMEGYADRPALGRRAYELATDAAGRSTVRLLPRFDTITYRQLWDRARGLAGEWHANSQHPLNAGDFACILGFASPDYASLILASIHLGAVIVPLQTSAPPSQHRDIIAETEPRILATGIDYLPNAVEAVLMGYAPQRLVVFDYEPRDDAQREKLDAARRRLADAGCPIVVDTLEALVDRGTSLAPPPLYTPPAEEDPLAWLFYTSGSTGTPKGAMFTQSLVTGTWLGEPGVPVITLSFMPMSHLVGNGYLLMALANGGTSYCFAEERPLDPVRRPAAGAADHGLAGAAGLRDVPPPLPARGGPPAGRRRGPGRRRGGGEAGDARDAAGRAADLGRLRLGGAGARDLRLDGGHARHAHGHRLLLDGDRRRHRPGGWQGAAPAGHRLQAR